MIKPTKSEIRLVISKNDLRPSMYDRNIDCVMKNAMKAGPLRTRAQVAVLGQPISAVVRPDRRNLGDTDRSCGVSGNSQVRTERKYLA